MMKKLFYLSSLSLFLVFLLSGSFAESLRAGEKTASGEVVCKEAMLNNYQIALSKCSDNQTWELNCQINNQKQSYECSCKKGGAETKNTSMTESPYKIVPESMEQTHKNAVAGANKICGFNVKYQP